MHYSNLEELTRMAKMVSDMLFLAQADNNQLIPEKKMLNLADEVGKVFDFFRGVSRRSRRGAAVCWRRVSGCGRSADAASGVKQPAF